MFADESIEEPAKPSKTEVKAPEPAQKPLSAMFADESIEEPVMETKNDKKSAETQKPVTEMFADSSSEDMATKTRQKEAATTPSASESSPGKPVAMTSGQRAVAAMFEDEASDRPAEEKSEASLEEKAGGSVSNLSIPSLHDDPKSQELLPSKVASQAGGAPAAGSLQQATTSRSGKGSESGGSDTNLSIPSLPMDGGSGTAAVAQEAAPSMGSARSDPSRAEPAEMVPSVGSSRSAGEVAEVASVASVASARSGAASAKDPKEETADAAEGDASSQPGPAAPVSVGDRLQAAIQARLQAKRAEEVAAAASSPPVEEKEEEEEEEEEEDEGHIEAMEDSGSGHQSFNDSNGSDAWA
eukprot:TRINITY_DN2484_c0_g1_i1.p1 TRINITY_DN2484_c0_g1~~TRINITY_DN2484_c0_g1_i1.p1  ORF type:complete len:356 (-),score=118.99 TRINITY_DN2484_c0_g1_i1:88-1155(-)